MVSRLFSMLAILVLLDRILQMFSLAILQVRRLSSQKSYFPNVLVMKTDLLLIAIGHMFSGVL